jgi:hypothetical protein
MTTKIKVALVMKTLHEYDLCQDDIPTLTTVATGFIKAGWTVEEVTKYLKYTEEVNPGLDEDAACAAMARTRKAVEARLAGVPV